MRYSSPTYWNEESWIGFLRRQVIVHSILYYEMDSPVISDKEYDRLCAELVEQCREHPQASTLADYYYCMYDFDGTTGFDLYDRLEPHDRAHLTHLAWNVSKLYKKEGRKDGD